MAGQDHGGDISVATEAHNFQRLLNNARQMVYTEWGRPAFEKLGGRIQTALLAEAVLAIAAQQDESVPDARVRGLVEAGHIWATIDMGA